MILDAINDSAATLRDGIEPTRSNLLRAAETPSWPELSEADAALTKLEDAVRTLRGAYTVMCAQLGRQLAKRSAEIPQ